MFSIFAVALLAGTSLADDFWITRWVNDPVGPDGPWHAINCSVDNLPWQNLTFLPSLTKTSLLIAEDACSQQSSACPNQVSSGAWPLWTSSTAHRPFLVLDGEEEGATTWDDTVSGPLRLQGSRQSIHETFRMWSDENQTHSLNDQATTLTHGMTATFPSGNKYTMNVGFFSLYGGENTTSWLNQTGTNVTQNILLSTAHNDSLIGSNSYGLHIGSPSLGIEPSLILGGYDRSRCLADPISSRNQTFQLTDIRLGTRQGAWPFKVQNNGSDVDVGGFLEDEAGVQVMPNPGVPYLYLPQDTCDAIAKFLPVTFNKDFGLYTWNTDETDYAGIVKSLSYLSFVLKGEEEEQTILVPFALLNLTLDYPLSRVPMQYFPCSPYTPGDGESYHLGRAFLQAALLAQNWQTETVWLAQAPGPDATDPSTPMAIEASDASISAMPSPPSWVQTWNTTLRASSSSSNSTSSETSPSSAESSSSLSGGAIAGIVIGVVAFIAILAGAAFFLIRRNRRSKGKYGDVPLDSYANSRASPPPTSEEKALHEAASSPVYEVADAGKVPKREELSVETQKAHPVEVQGSEMPIAELPAHGPPSR